jgi:RNA polymerase sigma factor (TIGR02999 family)
MNESVDLTQLIHLAQWGEPHAIDSLFSASYDNLRRLARARLRARRSDTLLDTTGLVHEFYLRFARSECLDFQNRRHFMCYASRVMRSVIVDCVRKRQAVRRGCGGERVTLTTRIGECPAAAEDEILRVHQAIDQIAKLDERMAQVVEMRYFAGMTDSEIADGLNVAARTVRRDWEKARLLLFEALQ